MIAPVASAPPALRELPAGPMAALAQGWQALQSAAGMKNPFLSWEWQSAWVAHLPHCCRPVVVAQAFPSGALAGVLALQRRRRHGLWQLEFLGQGSGADELDCLLHPAAPPETAARLLAIALRRCRWRLLRLEAADAGGALARIWPELFAGRQRQMESDEWMPTLPLPDSLEQLLSAHSSNFRAEVRRRRRRWASQYPQAQLEIASSPEAVGAALPHLFRLHNLRRSQKHGAGIFQSARLRGFHLQAAPALAAAGTARIYLLRTPEAVLAALYGFEAGPARERRFLYFQSGFDPACAPLSPGTVLLAAILEDCMARGVQRFDFLRGEERYKARWTRERHASRRLLAGRGWGGAAWLALRQGAHRLRGLRA
ncbi:MAG: GNAT family N-acetyltransferase [Terriglobales bacterium]